MLFYWYDFYFDFEHGTYWSHSCLLAREFKELQLDGATAYCKEADYTGTYLLLTKYKGKLHPFHTLMSESEILVCI